MTSPSDPIEPTPARAVVASAPGSWRNRYPWASTLQEKAAPFLRRNGRQLIGAAAVVALLTKVFWILARALTFSGMSHDEVHFLWGGWSINRGMVPYRDFFDFKPPLIFICNAIALKLLGLADQRYRYFYSWFAATAILGFAIALLTRRVNKGVILGLVFVIFALWIDPSYHDSCLGDAESIGIAFYLFGVSSLLAASRFTRFTDFAGGASLALAVLSKEPFALCVIPTWLAFASLRVEAAGRAEAWLYAKRSVAGVATVAFALLAYLFLTGSFSDYLAALARSIPFSKRICIEYGVWKPGPFLVEWQIRWANLSNNLVNFGSLGIALPLLLAPIVLLRRRQIVTTIFAGLSILGGLYAVTLGGCFFRHYYMLAMPGLFFFMALGAMRLVPVFRNRPPRQTFYFGLLFALVPGLALMPRIEAELPKKYAPAPPDVDPGLLAFVQANSTPDDTIFCTGWQDIYLFGDRRHAVKESTFFDAFLILYPGLTDEEKVAPIYQQLVKNRPKIIIIEPQLAEKRVRTAKALWLPFIQAFSYKKVDERVYLRPD